MALPPSGPEPSQLTIAYESRRKADCGVEFAWANIAVPAWTRMLYLAKFVLSSATSTSLMRLLAAERLSFNTPSCSLVEFKRETFAPTVARSVASVVMAAGLLVAGNFVADLLLAWSDPRIRLK